MFYPHCRQLQEAGLVTGVLLLRAERILLPLASSNVKPALYYGIPKCPGCVLLFVLKSQRHDELGQESRGGEGLGTRGRHPEGLSLEELPSLPTPANRARSRGWAPSRNGCWGGGGVRRLCVRGLPRFGGCGPRWAPYQLKGTAWHEVLGVGS